MKNDPPIGKPIHRLKSVGSTNDEAKRIASDGATHGTVVSAETQTAGRGRRGRPWASPSGNLFLSIVLRPAIAPSAAPPLAPAMGLAVAMAIEEAAPVSAQVKWPNDVMVNGKKVAGVLTESVVNGSDLQAVIVGIGLNVATELPPELAEIATTLAREAGRNVRKSEVEEALFQSIDDVYGRFMSFGFETLVADWQERDALRGRRVTIDTGSKKLEGIAKGIGDHGGLRLETEDGTIEVMVGEVL